MTHHDMNTDHLQQCADSGYDAYSNSTFGNSGADVAPYVAFAKAAISTYLKLNPVWVSASDRLPTMEDADKEGTVGVWSDYEGFSYCRLNEVQPQYFWTSIKHLPPPPDPFEAWLAKQPDDVRSANKELVRKIYNSIKP